MVVINYLNKAEHHSFFEISEKKLKTISFLENKIVIKYTQNTAKIVNFLQKKEQNSIYHMRECWTIGHFFKKDFPLFILRIYVVVLK